MLRELEGNFADAILICVNDTMLRFTIREFAIISDLNCHSNGLTFSLVLINQIDL